MSYLVTIILLHAEWTTPAPRPGEDIKTGPCGAAPGAPVATYEEGATASVVWSEFIDHPGHYRIALSPEGIDGEPEIIIEDLIPDLAGPRSYSRNIVIPNRPCARCTLQLIQVMTESSPPSLYYSCTDITITPLGGGDPPDAPPGGGGDDPPDASEGGGGSGTPDAGSGGGGGGGGGGDDDDDGDDTAGDDPTGGDDNNTREVGPTPGICSIGAHSAPAPRLWLPLLGLVGLLTIRRRNRCCR